MTKLRVLGPLFALSLAACVSNGDQNVVIIQNNAPNADCTVSASVEGQFYASGTIEFESTVGYFLTPVVQNFAEASSTQAEQQRIAFVQGAQVDITFPDDELFDAATLADMREEGLTRFEVPLAAPIQPGGTTSLGFEIVPKALMNAIEAVTDDAIVIAHVRLVGEMGGSDFESAEFRYPVNVCADCLSFSVAACGDIPAGFTPRTGGPCNPKQDGITDCCTSGTSLICPAVVPEM